MSVRKFFPDYCYEAPSGLSEANLIVPDLLPDNSMFFKIPFYIILNILSAS
jgi:hypothetical protein